MNFDRPAKVLVIDDDESIVFGLRAALEAEGYEVADASDGIVALGVIGRFHPDVLLLDLAMPVLGGLGVCRILRKQGDAVSILMLTASSRPHDRVAGLDAGADDYLGKPFDLDELLARVRALVRRAEPASRKQMHVRDFILETDDRTLVSPRSRIALTRIECAILQLFFSNPHRVRSRGELIEAVWGDDPGPSSNALEVYISALRRKLEKSDETRMIVTVRGLGYRID